MKYVFCTSLVLWAGMIISLSFIATPAKFLAPNISKPIALEVGKVTFHLFDKIEWVFLIAIIIIGYHATTSGIKWFILLPILVILLLQTFWLLPILDKAIAMIIADIFYQKIYHRLFYIYFRSL